MRKRERRRRVEGRKEKSGNIRRKWRRKEGRKRETVLEKYIHFDELTLVVSWY